MEVSIRYVHLQDSGMGNKPALCLHGRKHAHCVINDETGVRVIRVPIQDVAEARPIPYQGGTYPLDRFRREMLKIGLRKGITQAATELLERAETTIDDEPEPDPGIPIQTTDVKPHSKPPADAGKSLITSLASEFKLEPSGIRRRLRAAGLNAPYTDSTAIRRALEKK